MATVRSSLMEALQTLAEAGASDRLLAMAVRELLAETAKASGVVAAPSPAQAPSTVPPSRPAPPPLVKRQPTKPKAEIVVFKDAEGHRSSVSFTSAEWTEVLARHQGDSAEARATVRELAVRAPATDRSSWVKAQLLEEAARQ